MRIEIKIKPLITKVRLYRVTNIQFMYVDVNIFNAVLLCVLVNKMSYFA